MALTITVQPKNEPVTVDEAMAHVVSAIDADRPLLLNLIKMAREQAEELNGRAFITRTCSLHIAAASTFELESPPLQAISAIVATLTDGTTQAITTADYAVDLTGAIPVVTIDSMPATAEYLTITYTAGYGDTPDSVPWKIKAAILLIVAEFYLNREDPKIPAAAERLLDSNSLRSRIG